MHHVYLRVSTDKQDEEAQRVGVAAYLAEIGNPPHATHTDRLSGSLPWKSRKLRPLLEACAAGDTIIAAEISRLGRSTVDVLDFLAEASRRGVSVHITKSKLTVDSSIQSKIITTVLALAAEIERDFTRARTLEGLDKARASGKRLGRPPGALSAGKLEEHRAEVIRLLNAGVPHTAIGRVFGVSRGTVSRYVSRLNLPPA